MTIGRPFQPGNPGRPVGVRTRLTNSVYKNVLDDWEQHGPAVIKIVRVERPDLYFQVVCKLLPKEFLVADAKLGEYSEEELMALLAHVREEMRNQTARSAAIEDHKDHENEFIH
jgi:hypothetical protein